MRSASRSSVRQAARDTLDEWIYFLKNEEIKESFTAKGLKEAEEKLSIMKLPEGERKAYEQYQDDLRYQASMFESSYGDGYYTGKEEGIVVGIEIGREQGVAQGVAQGAEETTRTIALKLIEQGAEIAIIKAVTGLRVKAIEELMRSVR